MTIERWCPRNDYIFCFHYVSNARIKKKMSYNHKTHLTEMHKKSPLIEVVVGWDKKWLVTVYVWLPHNTSRDRTPIIHRIFRYLFSDFIIRGSPFTEETAKLSRVIFSMLMLYFNTKAKVLIKQTPQGAWASTTRPLPLMTK